MNNIVWSTASSFKLLIRPLNHANIVQKAHVPRWDKAQLSRMGTCSR